MKTKGHKTSAHFESFLDMSKKGVTFSEIGLDE